MSTEIHCSKCGKLIRAPEGSGGKHGKCPYCKQDVYIPTPADELEEIPLAPVDEADEQRKAELARESMEYTASLQGDEGPKYDTGPASDNAGARAGATAEAIDISAAVEEFILAMRDSKLETADACVARLKRTGIRARDHVQGMLLDQMPPQIGDVPLPLMKGFLKTLSDRLTE